MFTPCMPVVVTKLTHELDRYRGDILGLAEVTIYGAVEKILGSNME